MKTISINLPKELDEVHLHFFADLHIGDKACDIRGIKQHIQEVAEDPRAYCILNGDLLNNAIKTSVSDIYSERLTPDESMDKCVELFTPIKDKILCVTEGNHERRTHNACGVNLLKNIAERLGVADKYDPVSGLIFLRFGEDKKRHRRHWYSIYTTHGSGGGKKPGGKVNRLEDLSAIVDADIYVHSHTHLPVVMKKTFYRADPNNSSVRQVEKLFVNTSAQLDYGGYGEVLGFSPSSKANIMVVLSGTKKEFFAKL